MKTSVQLRNNKEVDCIVIKIIIVMRMTDLIFRFRGKT